MPTIISRLFVSILSLMPLPLLHISARGLMRRLDMFAIFEKGKQGVRRLMPSVLITQSKDYEKQTFYHLPHDDVGRWTH